MEKIKVLKKDIVNGNGNCGLSCAIALAVRRAFKTKNVFVIAYDEDNDDDNDDDDGDVDSECGGGDGGAEKAHIMEDVEGTVSEEDEGTHMWSRMLRYKKKPRRMSSRMWSPRGRSRMRRSRHGDGGKWGVWNVLNGVPGRNRHILTFSWTCPFLFYTHLLSLRSHFSKVRAVRR